MASTAAQLLGALAWALMALAGYSFLTAIYNLYFHPLREYPGPVLYRASILPRAFRILRGFWTRDLVDLAERYGPVIRVSPNMLVYTTADAWKEIYGHQNGAVIKGEEFRKDPVFYRTRNVEPNILSESRENHSLIRRQLSHGFSEKSLRAQESLITSYADLLVKRLKEQCEPAQGRNDSLNATKTIIDMKSWLNYTTFDVIGDLAFGEPFGCLEKGTIDPRVSFLDRGLQTAHRAYFCKALELDRLLGHVGLKGSVSAQKELVESTSSVLRRRMDLNFERHDLIEGLLSKQDDWKISFERLRTNATLLIIAGSETTATILSGLFFLLLTNPACMKELKKEIRATFKSQDDITFSSAESLPYMTACLKEALRFYPPIAGEMPRMVSKGGAHIAGKFLPEGTIVAAAQYAMNHCSRNFSDSFSFKPERFLEPENFPHDNFDVLQPFGYGPRNCIGRNLANAEMHTIVARLIFNFDTELVDKDEDWLDQKVFFVWHKTALKVYLIPVE